MIDFEITNEGTVVMVKPLTDEAKEWVDENVHTEGWQWMCGAFACAHRMAGDLISGIEAEGFTLLRRIT